MEALKKRILMNYSSEEEKGALRLWDKRRIFDVFRVPREFASLGSSIDELSRGLSYHLFQLK
jgi:hypothetical protein